MPARNENLERSFGERCEESLQIGPIRFREHSKPRNWTALASVIGRRNSPDAATPTAKLPFFIWRILLQAIRRIGNNRVHVVRRLAIHPLQAIRSVDRIADAV